MSKWTEIRDSVVEALDLDEVTDQVKEDLTTNILDNGIPALEDVSNAFITKIQSQATEETGWNKIRDQVVLPLLIKGAIYGIKLVLSKTVNETASTN
jgi:hypothetical protein